MLGRLLQVGSTTLNKLEINVQKYSSPENTPNLVSTCQILCSQHKTWMDLSCRCCGTVQWFITMGLLTTKSII